MLDCSRADVGDLDDPNNSGPLGMDYIEFYCEHNERGVAILFLLLGWVVFLIYVMGGTAKNYFSPTLGAICEKMRISYDVAGVTFLALGNAAPDCFSSVSSFTGGEDLLLGLGALLGSCYLVSTIVVGMVCITSQVRIQKHIFLRDICFQIVAVLMAIIVALIGYVNIFIALVCFFIYGLYVYTVMTGGWGFFGQPEDLDDDAESRGFQMTGLQTAYWFGKNKEGSERSDGGITKSSVQMKPPNISSFPINIQGSNLNGIRDTEMHSSAQKPRRGSISEEESKEDQMLAPLSSSGYSFLILNDNGMNGSDDTDDSDEDGEVTINLSGGLITPTFDGEIFDDYFAAPTSEGDHTISNSPSVNFRSTLNDSLLESDHGGCSTGVPSSSSSILNPQYWKNVQLRRRLHRNFFILFSSQWLKYPWYYKLLSFLESPFTLLRDLTIPTSDPELWNKPVATFQPIMGPLLIVTLLGDLTLASFLAIIFLGSPLVVAIRILTHQNRPPRGTIFGNIWVLSAFVMCIFWIYVIAEELIVCLSCIGLILGVPPGILGLTMLAWGNSVGDISSNVSVAMKGYGEMAIAGCYAGPIFEMLVGLGASYFLASLETYPSEFSIELDSSAWLTLIFLMISLNSTLYFVYHQGGRFDKRLGYYLMFLYAIYLIVQLFTLLYIVLEEPREH